MVMDKIKRFTGIYSKAGKSVFRGPDLSVYAVKRMTLCAGDNESRIFFAAATRSTFRFHDGGQASAGISVTIGH